MRAALRPVLALLLGGAAVGTAPVGVAPVGVAPVGVAPVGVAPVGVARAQQPLHNDFPTEARAEYVFACMAANGETQEILRRCSCSVDVIASIMPYDDYVEAETVLRMRQLGGEKTAVFRDTTIAKDLVAELRGAQAEAEIRCF